MPDIGKLVDLIKLPPRLLFGIALVCGIVLYGPAWLIEPTGLANLPAGWRVVIGVVFLAAAGLFISHWAAVGATVAYAHWKGERELRLRCSRLHDLTREEKTVLRPYIMERTRTKYLDFTNGVVAGLEMERIIMRPAPNGIAIGLGDMWAYNIQPWAWSYLLEHPELVTE